MARTMKHSKGVMAEAMKKSKPTAPTKKKMMGKMVRYVRSRKLKGGPVSVRFDERADPTLLRLIQARASAGDRSLGGQIKHYVRLATIAEDNPDLPLSMIQGILEAQAEFEAGLDQPYHRGVIPSA